MVFKSNQPDIDEENLHLFSARLAAIVESSDDIIISKDLNGYIKSWNVSAERILGYAAGEAIGRHISLIIPKERLNEEDEIISKIRAGERVQHYETIRRAKDGHMVDLSITVSPVKDQNGIIIGASKIARDISERKRTENQLREERETLETLNRLAPALASSLDVRSLIQHATDEATKVTGAAFGAFFYNVMSEDGQAYLLYTLSGAPKEAFSKLGMPRATDVFGPTFKAEGTIISDDITADPRYGKNAPHKGMPEGHLPVKSYLAVPVSSRTGEVIGGLFFGHPETGVFAERDARVAEGIAALAATGIDNARLYEQVKQGQKRAEEASRAKTDFLATMSHEIRTPMNAIIGLSSILSASSPLSSKQSECIRTLQTSADTLLTLINDLLDISKIEAKSVELEETPFSLYQLMNDIQSMMSIRAQEKGLKFSVSMEDVRGLIFVGDPTRLRQVVMNLCSNAVKFTEKGEVRVDVGFELKELDTSLISICVRDTGIGVAADKKDSIFEKFVQADTSISRKYGGTGLGLAISKNLIEAMQGSIALETEIGKGSAFTVSVPLSLAADSLPSIEKIQNKNAAEQEAEYKASGKVLLVEDYEPNVLVASIFLENLGYVCEVARDGLEALEKIRAGSYDAVLMDVQMPGLSGLEATKLIRAHEKEKGLKPVHIIGVTAHAMPGDRERCLREGMNEYMAKPFTSAELSEKLFVVRPRDKEAL